MRTPVKFRLIYIVFAIASYWLGSQLMPTELQSVGDDLSMLLQDSSWLTVVAISAWYFLLLPVLYWLWVIKKGKQAKWKLLISLSLSSLIARFTYPEYLAEYFEFITWLRYPIIAVLLILETYLLVTIVKALWQARSLTGDPRIHMLNQYDSSEARDVESKASTKMDLAVTLAHEPASWFYAIPRFTRRHPPTLANIHLKSASRWHFTGLMLATLIVSIASYLALNAWSEIAAILVSTFIFYGVVMLIANYRVSRYYSLYEFEDKLVVNNAWWGFCVISKSDIKTICAGDWLKSDNKEQVFVGSKQANIELTFSRPQLYLSGMGMMKDEVTTLYLSVDVPEQVMDALTNLNNNDE